MTVEKLGQTLGSDELAIDFFWIDPEPADQASVDSLVEQALPKFFEIMGDPHAAQMTFEDDISTFMFMCALGIHSYEPLERDKAMAIVNEVFLQPQMN